MPGVGQDSLNTRRTLTVGGQTVTYYSLPAAAESLGDLSRLPFSLKVLMENLLRHEDGQSVTVDDLKALAAWQQRRRADHEVAFRPARVLMQDFTGVPAVVDLAAMRDAVRRLDGDAGRINPLSAVDLVIDHSVMVDQYGTQEAYDHNIAREFERNGERYAFLRWGQQAFDNFRVVPPGMGICHQVNLEYLGRVVWTETVGGETIALPDTLVGTDSHTTMINGLGVLGWGVGGIEAEAVMLGQPISMVLPEVVGVRLEGQLPPGTTATDLVLTVVQRLRETGVVGKFVEFFGPGLDHLPLPDRATLANMAPEYGATCGLFPVDAETLAYLRLTGREEEHVALVEAYARAQGLWRDSDSPEPAYTQVVPVDMGAVVPSLAGPRRPQDRVALDEAAPAFADALQDMSGRAEPRTVSMPENAGPLSDGAVVIAAITSCTNTSNPSVLVAAGLLAQKAVARGLTRKPWVKTSLAPGSQVVMDYLDKAGLTAPLGQLGFTLAGFGCTTCIGNSGPLDAPVSAAVEEGDLVATSVLSGNRNFEGRVNPQVRANYLASPPLVVAYALAGSMTVDLTREPLGHDPQGNPVMLADLWPQPKEVEALIRSAVTADMFRRRYADVFGGPAPWRAIAVTGGQTYTWDVNSTYVKHPPFFTGLTAEPAPVTDIVGARPLAILGDSVTTDHISPAGSIKPDSPAGRYLQDKGIPPAAFNSFGARRGNHEVMMRGTFGNIRIRNEMVPGVEGGMTRHMPDGAEMPIYDAAMAYEREGTPLVVIAGKEYGTGSSRDWAAKGTRLLGVRAVIVETFERIHRSNLVGMGVLPLTFAEGHTRLSLGLDGSETFDIRGLGDDLTPRAHLPLTIHRADGRTEAVPVIARIDTAEELTYYRHGGILPMMVRRLAAV